jgi:DNA-binding NarL/FixJ family response regulator
MLQGVVVIRSASILAMLRMLFEMVWAVAQPVGVRAPDGSMTREDREIVMMLAAGVKDQAIARQLGMSRRTFERRIKKLLSVLGARTRFEAGMRAAHVGILEKPQR